MKWKNHDQAAIVHVLRYSYKRQSLKSNLILFAGTDADNSIYWRDENLSVSDFTRTSSHGNLVDYRGYEIIIHHYFYF